MALRRAVKGKADPRLPRGRSAPQPDHALRHDHVAGPESGKIVLVCEPTRAAPRKVYGVRVAAATCRFGRASSLARGRPEASFRRGKREQAPALHTGAPSTQP
jgi:hypothetical protein